MAKGRKITATFSDGTVLTRTTTLPLAFAWLATIEGNKWLGRDASGENVWGHGTRKTIGFASTRELADKAAHSSIFKKDNQRVSKVEIVHVTGGAL